MNPMNLTLHYYEPGKRPGTIRKAKRKVGSVWEAIEWMNANREVAFLPATVTRGWGVICAFLG